MNHDEILAAASDLPVRAAAPGDLLIEEEEPTVGIFILRSGTLEVRRDGQLVAMVTEPGSMVGEMATLLDSPSTADVVARDQVEVHVIDDPAGFFASHPEVAFFLARILAQRLHAVTGYLAELREAHGDSENHLGLASAVVDKLLASRGTSIESDPSDADIADADMGL